MIISEPRPRIKDCASAGFTMVELLIAVLIIAVCLIPLISVWDVGFYRTQESERLAQATSLARAELEAAKNKPFGEVAEGEFFEQGDDYDIEIIVSEVDDDWKEMEVKVYQHPRSSYSDPIVDLTTYLVPGGI